MGYYEEMLNRLVALAPEAVQDIPDLIPIIQGMSDALRTIKEAQKRGVVFRADILELLRSLGLYAALTSGTRHGPDSLSLALSAAYMQGVMDGLDKKCLEGESYDDEAIL